MSIPNNWGDWRPNLTPHTGDLQATDLIECTMIVGGLPVNTAITGAQIIAAASGGSVAWGAITGTLSAQTDLQTALNGKFDNPTGTTADYIDGTGGLQVFPTLTSADKMVTVGRNSTGSTLYAGTIIYISGSTGNRPNYVKAQANSEATSAGTFGVIQADIPNNSDGNAVTIGTLSNLDTRAVATHPFTTDTLVDGDTLYLSPTVAGYVTRVKPSAPNHLVYIGKVVRTSPTNGTIVYRIQNGYELDEIHDVAITSVANNDVLQYDSATSLWKNRAISSGLTVGTTAITSGTVGRVLFEGTGNVLQEDAALFWDNTNKRLGIGATPASTVRLDVRAQGALSTDLAFRVRNSANTLDILKVQGDAGIVHNGRYGLNTATNAGIDFFLTAGSGSSYGIYAIGTYGVAAISARPDTATTNYNFHASVCARFGAYYASNTGGGTTVTGIRIGYIAESFNANTFDNIGFRSNIANTGGGGSIAFDVVNGDFRFGTGTGTKIGTATTQKIGFWNATPIVQPTTAVAAATFVVGVGTAVTDASTFDGYTIGQIVKALRNTGILA